MLLGQRGRGLRNQGFSLLRITAESPTRRGQAVCEPLVLPGGASVASNALVAPRPEERRKKLIEDYDGTSSLRKIQGGQHTWR